MPEIQINVQPLFATPVALVEIPGADRLNAALRETILAHEMAAPSTQHSNLGGWQSDWDFDQWGGDAGDAVIATARETANKLTVDRATGKPAGVTWRLNCWANINRTGHGNEFHTHPGSYWSATYYVDDGGAFADASLGGEFEIQDPRGVAPAMYAPMLGFATPGGLAVGASETIRPKSGLMVMFPSWLSHAVRPYYGNRERISIALNLSL